MKYILVLLLFFPFLGSPGQTRERPGDSLSINELKQFSLEELMGMEMTSASRKRQRAIDIPGATQIISGEEIGRLGVSTIPEALRLSSSVEVARIDSRQWAVSIRGFNSSAANKLLVMIDGRTVYTPLFSGVFWDAQDVFLPDLDQIEIARGPGGTLWGGNAVNGVINIKTRSAKDETSQGMKIYGGGGTEQRAFGGIRYGGMLDSSDFYRVYLKTFNRDDSRLANDGDAQDSWKLTQGGFRTDSDLSARDLLTIQGDAYGGSIDQPTNGNIRISGGNFLSRWTRSLPNLSELNAQVYYDYTHRDQPVSFAEDLHTIDVDIQHHFPWGRYHELTWGVGYRFSSDHVSNSAALAFLPPDLTTDIFSAFGQADFTLVPRVLRVIVGSKFEHNSFSGFEYQPSGRIAYSISSRRLLWGAVSRAVRTPSRVDRDFYVPGEPPYLLAGGQGFSAEEVVSYELGYKEETINRVSFSFSTFYNLYDDIRSIEPGPPFVIMNGLEGTTYGAEAGFSWEILDGWLLQTGYSYFHKNITMKPWSMDANMGQGEGNDPGHMAMMISRMDLTENLHVDGHLRYVSELGNVNAFVPAYAELDISLGWRFDPRLEVSITGHDLLHREHAEFGSSATGRVVQRGMHAMLSWKPVD